MENNLKLNGGVVKSKNFKYKAKLFNMRNMCAYGENETQATFNLLFKLQYIGFNTKDEIDFHYHTPLDQDYEVYFTITLYGYMESIISILLDMNDRIRNFETTDRNRRFSATKFIK